MKERERRRRRKDEAVFGVKLELNDLNDRETSMCEFYVWYV